MENKLDLIEKMVRLLNIDWNIQEISFRKSKLDLLIASSCRTRIDLFLSGIKSNDHNFKIQEFIKNSSDKELEDMWNQIDFIIEKLIKEEKGEEKCLEKF